MFIMAFLAIVFILMQYWPSPSSNQDFMGLDDLATTPPLYEQLDDKSLDAELLSLKGISNPAAGGSGKTYNGAVSTKKRRYAVIIDAGSSGSRVLVYSWKAGAGGSGVLETGLSEIEPGAVDGHEWFLKEEPGEFFGLSSLASHASGASTHLRPLLDFASKLVPQDQQSETPIYLFATAGMRLVAPEKQTAILDAACTFIKAEYTFSVAGGCNRHVRVISGELEGILGWIAVNRLLGGFDAKHDATLKKNHPTTFGFLDMGGASAQIAFEPTVAMADRHSDDLTDVKLRLQDGSERLHRVSVTTFLGFGVNEARRRFVDHLIQTTSPRRFIARSEYELGDAVSVETEGADNDNEDTVVVNRRRPTPTSPDLSPSNTTSDDGEEIAELPVTSPSTTTSILKDHTTDVLKLNPDSKNSPSTMISPSASSSIAKSTPTIPSTTELTHIKDPCLPPGYNIPISDTLIVGSGNLDECMAMQKVLLNKTAPCIEDPCLFNGAHAPLSPFEHGKEWEHRFLGVAEYWYTGSEMVPDMAEYSHRDFYTAAETACSTPITNTTAQRRALQCFRSAWVLSVLHDGFGVPPSHIQQNADKANAFKPINEVGRFQASWTLGVAVLIASAGIPARTSTGRSAVWVSSSLVMLVGLAGVGGIVYYVVVRRYRGSILKRPLMKERDSFSGEINV
ncbi:hypothetical protein SmJEL517_g05458 [Synchytrium microbalum]|uniref:Apyrase n=1 Tax=Synchytrium microbalum TaxID=1806994 RepID=A0A507BZA3_9FUNG|nr:uncharacterized protein SmJEL517_g05458 [Synchytrium microbalum]TPX31124.1 hypothetical protein SmJEL517_g05458 [Synchytrium microbalum]